MLTRYVRPVVRISVFDVVHGWTEALNIAIVVHQKENKIKKYLYISSLIYDSLIYEAA